MSEQSATSKKFIMGWLTVRPGKRDEFMAISEPFISATLQEQGVIFFEFHPSLTDPNLVIVVECYATPEVQDFHHKTPHFAAMWEEVQRLIAEARFENIFAASVVTDIVTFEAPARNPKASK
jgi:quinol monooxygenase YgiN